MRIRAVLIGDDALWVVYTDGRMERLLPGGHQRCQDPAAGGRARLTRVVEATGTVVRIGYDRPRGILLALSDDMGHSLSLLSTTACTDGLASSLEYDGVSVASYAYLGSDLQRATDGDGAILRSYVYDPTTARLRAVLNEASEAVAEFAYDASVRAIGIIDKKSNASVNYDAAGGIEVIEYFGNTSSTSTRTLNGDGRVTSISGGCACGPARIMNWNSRRLQCVSDGANRVTWQDFDVHARLTHRVEASSAQGCAAGPPAAGPTSREEWWEYGIARPVAQGVSIPLDRVVAFSRRSAMTGGTRFVAQALSYDPAPQSIDPAGYSCQQAPLPEGSVVCRQIDGGYTYIRGWVVFERHASFSSYDSRGRLIRTLGPISLDYPSPSDVTPIEERSYWADGEALVRRGRLKQIMRYPSPSVMPLVTSYDYDAFGPFQVTRPDGGITTAVKDGRGRTIIMGLPDGGQRRKSYYDGLDPSLEVQPSGAAVRSTYGSMGRLVAVEYLPRDPTLPGAQPVAAWSEHYAYDAAGNRIHTERRDAAGAVVWAADREYDVQHRVVKEVHPDDPGSSRTYSFDAAGFLASSIDESGRETRYTPDGLGRTSKVTGIGIGATGSPVSLDVARYGYQPYVDSLAQVTDGANRATDYSYDDFGRPSSVTSSILNGSGAVRFEYDARGNVLKRWKDGQFTAEYAYDGLNRLMTVNARESIAGTSVAYTYRYDEQGALGHLTTVVEPERTVQYGRDALGRVRRETIEERGVAVPLVTQYAYDADGYVVDIVYPSGLAVRMTRDPATGKVVEVKNLRDGTSYASSVAHAPDGPAQSLEFGNGVTLARSFNRRYEPAVITSGPLALTYGMTAAGDVLSVTQGGVPRTFEYDFLDRLTGSPAWLGYAYDGSGNRTWGSEAGAARTYTFSDGRLARQIGPGGVPELGFSYDLQGHMNGVATFDSGGAALNGALCWRHDALGRLVTLGTIPSYAWSPYYFEGNVVWGYGCFSGPSVGAAEFKYDAGNRRIARWWASTDQWIYVLSDPQGNPLSELLRTNDPANPWTKVRDYVWLDGKPLAQIEYPGPSGSIEGYVYYFHVDHIGLPRALTNQAGQTVWSAEARPYGDIVESATTDPLSGRVVVTNLRLPGQYDERLFGSLGLQGPYYNWNRWYLPGVGRYLELDPLALRGGFNSEYGIDWYGYSWQNPMRWSDPSALVPCGLGDTTYTCCLKKFPGCPECCGGETPPTPPATPGQPPKLPEPPPTCPTTGQPPPPDVPPMPPGTGCKAMFDVCMGWAASSPSYPGRVARAAGCMAAYIACLARGG